jgi:hypothetical protein
MVEHWNLKRPCGVDIDVPYPPLVKNSFFIVNPHHIKNNNGLINGWSSCKVMKFGHKHM